MMFTLLVILYLKLYDVELTMLKYYDLKSVHLMLHAKEIREEREDNLHTIITK